MAGSWFEESDEADAILAQGKLSKAKRKAALLAGPMPKRRRWWAALIAWTGFTMKHVQECIRVGGLRSGSPRVAGGTAAG